MQCIFRHAKSLRRGKKKNQNAVKHSVCVVSKSLKEKGTPENTGLQLE